MMDRAGTKCLFIAAAAALLFSITSFDNADASTTHKVKKGDNIYTIAKKYKTSSAKIREANDLASDKLSIGQKLVIPADRKVSADSAKNRKKLAETKNPKRSGSDENVYTVAKGDSIYTISKKFRTTPAKIKEANDLDSNKLKIGRKLVIPGDNKTKVADAKEKKQTAKTVKQEDSGSRSSGKQTYTVQKRDNIAKIAKKFNTTAARIREANDLDSNKLKVGQKIVIPSGKTAKIEKSETKRADYTSEQKAEKQYYTVHKGDSLAKIAKKFNTTTSRIMEANNLDSKKLKVGRKLVIPSGQEIKTAQVKAKEEPAAVEESDHRNSETLTYTVRKKDNIAKIAKKFNTTAARIREANNLDSDKLKIGQKIEIPSVRTAVKEDPDKNQSLDKTEKKTVEHNESNERHYIVHKGDNIEKIAKKFHTTAEDIREDNKLDSDKLAIGRDLVIHPDTKESALQTDNNKKTAMSVEEKTKADITADEPESSPVYKYHRVQRGETLKSISKKYGISVRELIAINDIKTKKKKKKKTTNITVSVGQNLIVGNLSGGKSRRIQRVDISQKIEQVKELSQSPELAEMSTTDRLLLFAKKMLDIPYKFGGNGGIGIDCSSFVQRVYSFVDFKLPRSAREQFQVGQKISKDELKSGDLIFFRTYARFPSHVGIYIGDNLFIHASSLSKKVTIDSLDKPYYVQRYIGAKRLLTGTVDKVEDAAAAIVSETVRRHSLPSAQ